MNQYKQTLHIEDMHIVAANKGGKCLSPIYLGSRVKLEWECSEGHRWWQKPDHIKNTGTWCAKCAFAKKTTQTD